MATANLQRFTSQIHRLPFISFHSKSLFSRCSASASPSASSSSKKVADRIVKLFAIDPEGQKREFLGLSGHTLLKALTNHGLIDPASHRLEEIAACSAECEVNIAQEWLDKLPPRSYDEEYVLKRNSRSRILNKHSRLGCQVVLTDDLQDMVVAVPEPKPWDTPEVGKMTSLWKLQLQERLPEEAGGVHNKMHRGYMFSLLVNEELNHWPEKGFRKREWKKLKKSAPFMDETSF